MTERKAAVFYIWWPCYKSKMQTPPPNYKVGLERSQAQRSASAKVFEREAWTNIFGIACLFNPHTLQEYCSYLNGSGIPTARGGRWSPGLVSRVMKQHGVTAKSLLKRVTHPPTREQKKIPAERYKEWGRQIAKIDNDGRWVMATIAPVRRNDLIRHPARGEGQAIRVYPNGRVLCRFGLSLEINYPLTELEVFHHTYSREERQKASRRIAERLGI